MVENIEFNNLAFVLSEKQKNEIASRLRFSFYIWGSYFGSAILYPLFNYLKYPEKSFNLYDLPTTPYFFTILFFVGVFFYFLAYIIKVFILRFPAAAFNTNPAKEIDLDPYLKAYEKAILYSQGAASGLVFVAIFALNAESLALFYFFFLSSIVMIFNLRPKAIELENIIIKNNKKSF